MRPERLDSAHRDLHIQLHHSRVLTDQYNLEEWPRDPLKDQ